MKDSCEWLNFRWGLDIQYTHVSEAPILAELCQKYKRFWDGEHWYTIQAGKIVLKWPDWRKNYRVDMEKVRTYSNLSNQTRLLEVSK